MNLKIYQADAFTQKIFGGNPAAVVPLDEWLSDTLLQNIAMETNLPDTAFYVKTPAGYDIRWFTPQIEVALCGHATLATAHVLFNHEGFEGDEIQLSSKSGLLKVKRDANGLTLNFPADTLTEVPLDDTLRAVFYHPPTKAFKGKTDYMLVFATEEEIKTIQPDYTAMMKLDCRGCIVTAPGTQTDFVSRFFVRPGQYEDPVTGSAHTSLMPYWAGVLKKTELEAAQLSARGGLLKCALAGDRVYITGQAVTFMQGIISL